MRLPTIPVRQGEVPVVGRNETIDVTGTGLLKLCSIQFDKQSISNAILIRAERDPLAQAPLDYPGILKTGWLKALSGAQQFGYLAEILRRHRINQRNMLRSFRKPGMLVLVPGELTQFPAQPVGAENLRHLAGCFADRGPLAARSRACQGVG
jgi:hypothetical protein